ncbi:hypothetical protein ACWGJW_11860 [Streptomyces nigrescens]
MASVRRFCSLHPAVPPGGGKITFEIANGDPKNPATDRFTTKRFDSAHGALNSVVFRPSSQDLTMAGRYIEMASRFSEPVLLGFAALSIRGRGGRRQRVTVAIAGEVDCGQGASGRDEGASVRFSCGR